MLLELENFKCFKEKKFEISGKLVLVQGNSGTGKSTLFDAIYFAITGKGKDLIMKGQTKCKVCLTLPTLKIERKKGPEKLLVYSSNKVYEKMEAQAVIDISSNPYFIIQNKDSFPSMTPNERQECIENWAMDKENITMLDLNIRNLIKERKTNQDHFTINNNAVENILQALDINNQTLEYNSVEKVKLEIEKLSIGINNKIQWMNAERNLENIPPELKSIKKLKQMKIFLESTTEQKKIHNDYPNLNSNLVQLEYWNKLYPKKLANEIPSFMENIKRLSKFEYKKEKENYEKIKKLKSKLATIPKIPKEDIINDAICFVNKKIKCPACQSFISLGETISVWKQTEKPNIDAYWIDAIKTFSLNYKKEQRLSAERALENISNSLTLEELNLVKFISPQMDFEWKCNLGNKTIENTYKELKYLDNRSIALEKIINESQFSTILSLKEIEDAIGWLFVQEQNKMSKSININLSREKISSLEKQIPLIQLQENIKNAKDLEKKKRIDDDLIRAKYLLSLKKTAEFSSMENVVKELEKKVNEIISLFFHQDIVIKIIHETRINLIIIVDSFERSFKSFSKGEQARINIAFGIVFAIEYKTPWILLDEILSSLDQENKINILKILNEILPVPIFCICHDLVSGIFDQVIAL